MREDPRREMRRGGRGALDEVALHDPGLVAPRRLSERHDRSRHRQPAGAACSDPEPDRRSITYLPLNPADIVYAAGSPKLVDAVRSIAVDKRRDFYADAFVPSSSETETRPGLLSRVVDRLMGDAQSITMPTEQHLPGRAGEHRPNAPPAPSDTTR